MDDKDKDKGTLAAPEGEDPFADAHSHRPDAIAARLDAGPPASYLRDYVYGGIDGAVTTFAITAGVVGAQLSAAIVLVLGLANLLADGFSMAASSYSGARAEEGEQQRLRAMEEAHIARYPEGEREEVRQIFQRKGFEGEALEQAVATITSDKARWVEFMLAEEHGLAQVSRTPWRSGAATFIAFLTCGAVPLLPFALGLPSPASWSIAMTGGVFLGIGALKGRFSAGSWVRSSLETFALGMTAAAIAYLVGALLRGLTGVG